MTTNDRHHDHGVDQESAAQERQALTLGQRFRQPQTLLSFLFAILIVVFLVRRLDIDPDEAWRQIRSANPIIYLGGVLAYYSGFLIRVVRWRRMLATAGVSEAEGVTLPSNGGMLEILLLSWFANCVVPAKLGDVYRAFLLKRRANAPFTTTMGTIAAERLIDLVVLVILLLGSGLIVFGRHFPSGTRTVMVYGSATVLIGVVGVVVAWFFREPILRRLPDRLASPIDRIQFGLYENLRNPWASIGLSLPIWIAEGARFLMVAWSLDVVLPASTALFFALLSSLATVSPITPAGLGVVEAVLIAVLPLVGVSEDSAAAIAILDRTISYFSLILVGLPLYVMYVRRDVATAVQQEPSSA